MDTVIVFDNAIPQIFSLPQPIIFYLMDDFETLQKLLKTCKYFKAKLRFNLVKELLFMEDPEWEKWLRDKGENLELELIRPSEIHRLKDNIWVTQTFLLGKKMSSAKIIPKVAKFDLKSLLLHNDVTFEELKILLKQSKRLNCIKLTKIYYSSSDKGVLPIEEILSLIPHVRTVFFYECHLTKNSMNMLLKLERKVKLNALRLFNIDSWLDPTCFNEFLLKNLENGAGLTIIFNNKETTKMFHSEIIKKINLWTPTERKPDIPSWVFHFYGSPPV